MINRKSENYRFTDFASPQNKPSNPPEQVLNNKQSYLCVAFSKFWDIVSQRVLSAITQWKWTWLHRHVYKTAEKSRNLECNNEVEVHLSTQKQCKPELKWVKRGTIESDSKVTDRVFHIRCSACLHEAVSHSLLWVGQDKADGCFSAEIKKPKHILC
jgi:hypothetical protein